MTIASVNPATGETLRTFAPLTDAELDARLERAARAFQFYRHTTFDERRTWLARAAELLEAEAEAWGAIMTLEMGKPIASAVQEARKCARACRYYVEHGEALLADEPVATEARASWIRYEPLGPVLAVMPWNFPFWQVVRFAAPALMAGNVGLLKHASNVPRCALALEDLFRRAGFPEDAFQALLVESDMVARILDDPRVAAATLTGSTRAGSAVAERAGKRLKPSVMELGGSDPYVVLPSADVATAAATAVQARVVNNGQSCIAAKRFIVHAAVWEEFCTRFVEAMRALRVGDPMDPATDVGPLASAAQRDGVARQVDSAVTAGARLLLGGRPLEGRGWFYPPTVLTDVGPDSPIYRDEVFGPVALLFRVPDLDAAIRLANDTPFGLGASAWTRDAAEQRRLVAELEAGMVYLNSMVVSDPRLPFGGIKESGYGRELGPQGIRGFVNVKTVWVGA
ncbi:MAG TPA: NAD-dependent succinate-semialdehyde dehydrogenase [Gemmatimonadales bacterium]|nr:NAD-dependent succinate-semialdehyde dehydrogenase [Gemmatimonadales bacterium]